MNIVSISKINIKVNEIVKAFYYKINI